MFSNYDNNFYYDGNDLGASYCKEKTVFKVWSPVAQSISVRLYNTSTSENPYRNLPMVKNNLGVWEKEVFGDLNGVYYTYSIMLDGIENETIDIYAKTAGVNGAMGMVLDMAETSPYGFDKQNYVKLDRYTDAVIYELHVRDFSINPAGNFKNKGKFLAFSERGLTNAQGDKVGIDHLVELGVTHVHLLPIADYQTVDESKATLPDYNWGYDSKNFNVPEGSYSSNAYDGKCRISEYKRLVYALHEKNIGVVMDVVYNHTYHTADSAFNMTFPKYYYRQWNGDINHFSNGSGCGNELATERKMVRKYIIDSLTYWMTEFKIDGFRFDLMGLYDTETINEIYETLHKINPNVILYGEGWTGADSPLDYERRAMKLRACHTPNVAYFSDDFRDTVKGNNFRNAERGYVNGGNVNTAFVKEVISGRIPHPQLPNLYKYSWTKHPMQTVNYVEAHDNLTLWDKLYYSNPTDSIDTRKKMDKLAAAIVFLSQGIPFFQAGQEFLRSKPLPGGFSFDHNSYKSPDYVNSLKWDRKSEFADVFEYYKGLIALRKSHSAFRYAQNHEVCEHLHFFDNLPQNVVGFSLSGDNILEEIIVFFNPNRYAVKLHAFGEYDVFVDDKNASATAFRKISGDYELAPISAIVLGR